MSKVTFPLQRLIVDMDRDLAFNARRYISWQLPSAPGLTRTYSLAAVVPVSRSQV